MFLLIHVATTDQEEKESELTIHFREELETLASSLEAIVSQLHSKLKHAAINTPEQLLQLLNLALQIAKTRNQVAGSCMNTRIQSSKQSWKRRVFLKRWRPRRSLKHN